MGVFCGMLKFNVSVFLLGEVVSSGSDIVIVKNLIREVEMPISEARIALAAQPDPYFMSEFESKLMKSDFVAWRISESEDDPVHKRYHNFLTKYRAQRSGIVLEKGSVKSLMEEK